MRIAALAMVFLMLMSSVKSLVTAKLGSRCAIRLRLERFSAPTADFTKYDEHFMKLALRHAQHAARETEVPIGAVIVGPDGTVLAASRNQVEVTKDATAHAEVVVMRNAAQLQGTWRLSDCTLYSTLEPCAMCLAAMQSFRVSRLVYGARDIRMGACGSFVNLSEQKHPFHNIHISGGLLAEKSEVLLKRFFQNRRVDNVRLGEDGGTVDLEIVSERGMPASLCEKPAPEVKKLKSSTESKSQQHSLI